MLKDDLVWMVEQGMTDIQIGRRMGYSDSHIQRLRRKFGIRRKATGGPKPKMSRERLIALTEKYTDARIAAMYDIAESTVGGYRARWGIYRHHKHPVPPKEELQALMDQGLTQDEIAAKYGAHQPTVQRWQAKYGLVQPKDRQKAAQKRWGRQWIWREKGVKRAI